MYAQNDKKFWSACVSLEHAGDVNLVAQFLEPRV